MERADVKRIAKQNLKGNWGIAIIAFLLYGVVTAILSSTGLGVLLLGACILIGYYSLHINIMKNQNGDIKNLIDGFKDGDLGSRIIISVVKNLFIVLWSFLFVIPGIVKSYSYSLVELLSLKNPEWDYKECLEESERLMKGHKMELFILDLSFLGWIILSCLTCGILTIYVSPYQTQTKLVYIHENIMPLYDKNIIDVDINEENI